MLRKKSKRPRIISRQSFGRSEEDGQIGLAQSNDCEERNVLVQRGLAFYKRSQGDGGNGQGEVQVGTSPNWPIAVNPIAADREIGLPGMADEFESYPCRICPDERVFMTRTGLERHAENEHLDRLPEMVEMAEQIQKEWQRRRSVLALDSFGPRAYGAPSHSSFLKVPTQRLKLTTKRPIHCQRGWPGRGGAPRGDEVFRQSSYGQSNLALVKRPAPEGQICLDPTRHSLAFSRPTSQAMLAQVQCEICGLFMARPSLIERHMLRVHNISVSSASASANCSANPSQPLPTLNHRLEQNRALPWSSFGGNFANGTNLLAYRAQDQQQQCPWPIPPIHQQNAEQPIYLQQHNHFNGLLQCENEALVGREAGMAEEGLGLVEGPPMPHFFAFECLEGDRPRNH